MSRILLLSLIIVIMIALGAGFKLYLDGSRNVTGGTEELIEQSSLTSESNSRPVSKQDSNKVEFDGVNFNPSVLRVALGQTVQFSNTADQPVWVASIPHPDHSAYSLFDALRGYASHETFSFTFDQAGTWQYHNHLEPNQIGTIIVEQ